MSYIELTDKQVELRRAVARVKHWETIAELGYTASVRDWAARQAAQAKTDLKRLQEEKACK